MTYIQVYSPLKEFTNTIRIQEVTLTYHNYKQTYILTYKNSNTPQITLTNIRQNTLHNLINYIRRAIKHDIADTENITTTTDLMNLALHRLIQSHVLLRMDGTRGITKMIDNITLHIKIKSYIKEA